MVQAMPNARLDAGRIQMPKVRPGRKVSDRLQDMDDPEVLGYKLDKKTFTPERGYIDLFRTDDYGADPLGDGTFMMYPSGEIVDWDERCLRLNKA